MDLGSYDDANLHNKLLEYHLNRPAIIMQQKPDETLDKRVGDIQRLAHRAFVKLFAPRKVISELKERRSRSVFYNKEVEGNMVLDEFIFDSNDELIAGIRYRTVAEGIMQAERVIYRSLDGIGVVLLYKNGIASLEWDNPKKITGIQLDLNGKIVKNLWDMLKIYQTPKQENNEPEVLVA